MRSNIFDRISFISLSLIVILLPIFCLPFTNIPVETGKGLLLVLGLTISIVFWAIARFTDGKIILPKSWLLVSGGAVALVVLLSALASGTSQVSLFGTIFDIGSFWFIFTAFVFMFMCSVVFRNLKQAKMILFGTILSSAVVLVFQSIHLFASKFLSLGLWADKTGNVLGSWNALGLFAGFSTLMFLLVIEFFPISKIMKIFLQVFILLSVLLAAAVNFPLVWILLGISSLIIFVYKVSVTLNVHEEKDGEPQQRRFPLVSFVVVIISLLFFMSPNFIGSYIPNRLSIANTEVSPSFVATMSVTKGVLKSNPIFGIGPNRFGEAWAAYKPLSINSKINGNDFWDVYFNSGSGLLPTLMSTTGALGIIAWAAFLILFLIVGLKSVFSGIKKGVNWEMMAFFVLSLYLFISAFFYSTGIVIFLLSLAFTGVFIGLTASGSRNEISILFLNDHRKSFFSILILILLVICSFALAFKYIERFASVTYFGKALTASTEPLAEDNISKALALYTNDLYLRTYSQIFFIKLKSIANKGGTLSDADKKDFENSFGEAKTAAQMAIAYNPKNYINFQFLGSLSEGVGPLGIKDGYSSAITAYQQASALNPLNPGIKLAIANAYFLNGDTKDAKDYGKQALTLKPDYIDALFFLSQIAKSEGNNAEAQSYAEAALSLDPTNKDLIQNVNSINTPASNPAPDTTSKKPKN
jgi:tetratricopeptide (TPR) repeat protein